MPPVTKWNTSVERIDAIPEIVRKAFRIAELEKRDLRSAPVSEFPLSALEK